MQTIRTISNGLIRNTGPLKKNHRTASSFFDVGCGDAAAVVSPLAIHFALPPLDNDSANDRKALCGSKACLEELESWRRRWVQLGSESVVELQRIQNELAGMKAESAKIQVLLDEVRILVAVEIAKRSK